MMLIGAATRWKEAGRRHGSFCQKNRHRADCFSLLFHARAGRFCLEGSSRALLRTQLSVHRSLIFTALGSLSCFLLLLLLLDGWMIDDDDVIDISFLYIRTRRACSTINMYVIYTCWFSLSIYLLWALYDCCFCIFALPVESLNIFESFTDLLFNIFFYTFYLPLLPLPHLLLLHHHVLCRDVQILFAYVLHFSSSGIYVCIFCYLLPSKRTTNYYKHLYSMTATYSVLLFYSIYLLLWLFNGLDGR